MRSWYLSRTLEIVSLSFKNTVMFEDVSFMFLETKQISDLPETSSVRGTPFPRYSGTQSPAGRR